MAYASAIDLRNRYRQGVDGADEFALREDADLNQALIAASAEIDRWRPQGDLGAAALDVLRDVAMTLGRMIIHQDQALGDDHPIVREAREARAGLRSLASGTVRLPGNAATIVSPIAAAPRTLVYGDAWMARYEIP